MLHTARTWFVTPVETPEALARKLTYHSWTLCTGFELFGYLFLNDSACECEAAEFAVVKKPLRPDGPYVQVESITAGWGRPDEALALIRRAVTGAFDAVESARVVTPRLETPDRHSARACGHCA